MGKETQETKTAKRFIKFLKRQGVIDDQKAASFDNIWRSRFKFGIIALREGMVDSEQLFEVLEQQATEPHGAGRIGELMIDKSFMTPGQVKKVLEIQQQEQDAPAEILADTGLLPQEVIDQKLDEFMQSPAEDDD